MDAFHFQKHGLILGDVAEDEEKEEEVEMRG